MKRKKANGHTRRVNRRVNDRKSIVKARGRVLQRAIKQGTISNDEVKAVMKVHQAWYHLNKMAEAGVLKRTGYDSWEPVRRRGRPPTAI